MRGLLLVLLLLGMISSPRTSADPGEFVGKRYALVIGVSRYNSNQFAPLEYATRDAQRVAAALERLGFEVTAMNKTIGNPNLTPATPEVILEALQDCITKTTKEDTVVVYFSGRGVELVDPIAKAGKTQTYLCPELAIRKNRKTLLPLSQISQQLKKCAATRKLLLVDLWRDTVPLEAQSKQPKNNPGTALQQKRTAGVAHARNVLKPPALVERRVQPNKKNAPQARLQGATTELKPIGPRQTIVPGGLIQMVSYQPSQSSASRRLSMGVFSHFMVRYLHGEADPQLYQENIATATQLIEYTHNEARKFVKDELDHFQMPILETRAFSWPLGKVRTQPRLLVEVRSDQAPVKVRSQVVGTAQRGDVFEVLQTNGKWLFVSLPAGQQGYLRAQDVQYAGGLITNSLGMQLCYVPPGTFVMGSLKHDRHRAYDEHQHQVTLSRGFLIGRTEVTIGQFKQFVKATGYRTDAERSERGGWGRVDLKRKQSPEFHWRNPGFPQTDDHPVTNVSWNDAQMFLRWLSREEGHAYRLPTEAEWEYAHRAGSTTRYWHGDDPDELASVGNVADATARAKFGWTWTINGHDGHVYTAPVGRYRCNVFGLQDTHGNLIEWCQDWYIADHRFLGKIDPVNLKRSKNRVMRGGGWNEKPRHERSGDRNGAAPNSRSFLVGFRVARSLSSHP